MNTDLYDEVFQVGDLVKISPNSQLIEHDFDGSKTLKAQESTVKSRFKTDAPILGVVFHSPPACPPVSYLGVVIENQRWFVRHEFVTRTWGGTSSPQHN